MNHKKSMRIFWLSLCLLLISGALIIAVVQYKSHKNEKNGSRNGQEDMEPAFRTREAQPDMDSNTDDAAAAFAQPHAQSRESAVRAQITTVGEDAAQYRFELKVLNGYLDVFHYHTDNLFFHTGIPYSAMTAEQRKELEEGKYFTDEQELYGYLESCTS